MILVTIPINSNAVTVEISKDYNWDVLYFESNLSKEENNLLIQNFSNFQLKEVIRPIKTCDRIDYSKKTNTCFRVIKNENGIQLTYRNKKELNKLRVKNFNELKISNYIYKQIFKKDSPLLTNLILAGQSIVNNKLEHSIFLSNLDGSKTKNLLKSSKSIISLSLHPNKKTLAYISYENIYPTIFLHDIITNNRISLSKIPGKINSLTWDLSGDSLLLSIKHNESNYNIYKFNVKNNSFAKITNFDFDVISPKEFKKDKIVYTSIHNKYPSAYISDIGNRQTKKLNISKKLIYVSDIYSDKDRTLALTKSKGEFTLLLLDSPNSKLFKRVISSESIESPKFIKNKPYFLLTNGNNFGNNVSLVNEIGKINKKLSFKNIKITELEII